MDEESGDRYVDLDDAIGRVIQEEDFPQGQVEKFELVCHASGDVTWRAWTPRAEAPIGGYISEQVSPG